MSVRERVNALEQITKEKGQENQMTQQQQSNASQNDSRMNSQQSQFQDNQILLQLDKVLQENEDVAKRISGSISKQNQKSINQRDSDEEDNTKTEQIYLNENIIQQVNSQEMDSENRILVGIVANELTHEISRAHRQSMDMQAVYNSERTQSVLKSNIIFNDCFEPIAIGEDQFYLLKIEKIIFIQRTYKEKYRKALQLKLEKINRYRINVLNELLETEKKYVQDLELLKNVFERIAQRLENQEPDIRKIFPLTNILNFNTAFYEELSKTNFKANQQEIVMGKIRPLLNGFIFYYEYCKEYEKARKQFLNFQQNQNVQLLLKEIKQENLLKGLEIDDYSIKPVQRLPKYLLLLKDLLKHTPTSHPDYKNIVECYDTINKINDKNNNEMEIYLNQLKLLELQRQFQDDLQICEPNRFFIFEDICQMFTKKVHKRIIIYCFNNLLLFVKNKKQNIQKYLTHLPICYYSYIKDIKDSNLLFNAFQFVTKGDSVILLNSDPIAKSKLLEKLNELINKQQIQKQHQSIYKDDKLNIQHIRVEVLSTENRTIQNKPTTLYITMFYIKELKIKIAIRFNQIFQIQQIIHKYDSNLKIPTFTKNLHSNNKQVVETRKLQIEQLLLALFNSEKCQQNQEYQKQILEALNMNPQFFSLKSSKIINSEMFSQSQIQVEKISLEFLQQQQFKFLQTNLSNEENQVKLGAEAIQQPYYIEITMMTGQIVTVGFKKNTITWFIKKAIANFQQIKQFVDFRIFIIDSSNLCRVLDDNEKISALLDKNQSGFFSALKKIFQNQTKFQFLFRKYIFLPWKYEEIDYLQDENRLRYLMYEVAFQSKNQIFSLLFKDYCYVAAIFSIATNQKIDKYLLQKVIPSNIRKQQTEKVWLDAILKEKCEKEKLLQQNQNNLKQQNQIIYNSYQNIAALILVRCFQSNILYGMQLYYVECTKDTIQLASQKNIGLKLSQYTYIGLNYEGIYFIKTDTKKIIAKIDYDYVSDLKSFPIEFVCKVKQQELHFKTQSPYELKQQILEYQQIRKILNS